MKPERRYTTIAIRGKIYNFIQTHPGYDNEAVEDAFHGVAGRTTISRIRTYGADYTRREIEYKDMWGQDASKIAARHKRARAKKSRKLYGESKPTPTEAKPAKTEARPVYSICDALAAKDLIIAGQKETIAILLERLKRANNTLNLLREHLKPLDLQAQ